MQKMLEHDRDTHRKAAEVQKQPPEQIEQPEAKKIQEPKEAPKAEKSKKLYPDSALFKEWGDNLSEDDQREAEGLFKKYGYNVFLSDRLPLDRALPDTRDPRYNRQRSHESSKKPCIYILRLHEARDLHRGSCEIGSVCLLVF